jgi:hypothetical protein
VPAKVIAMDARVDSTTRNTTIRALLTARRRHCRSRGSSVRVRVPVEAEHDVARRAGERAAPRPVGRSRVTCSQTAPDGKLRATTRRVTAGASIGDEVIVLAGLKRLATWSPPPARSSCAKARSCRFLPPRSQAKGQCDHEESSPTCSCATQCWRWSST